MNKPKKCEVCEETYSAGNILIDTDTGVEYIIAMVEHARCCLINLEDGNRYVDPVYVNKPSCITTEEMEKMTDGDLCQFKRLKA